MGIDGCEVGFSDAASSRPLSPEEQEIVDANGREFNKWLADRVTEISPTQNLVATAQCYIEGQSLEEGGPIIWGDEPRPVISVLPD